MSILKVGSWALFWYVKYFNKRAQDFPSVNLVFITLLEIFSFCHPIIKFLVPFGLPWKYKTSSNIWRQIPDYI